MISGGLDWYLPDDPFMTHSNYETYPCRSCGRVYKHRGNLRRHEVYECGKTPQFECPHCVKRFHQQSNLKRHIDTLHMKHNDKNRNDLEYR